MKYATTIRRVSHKDGVSKIYATTIRWVSHKDGVSKILTIKLA